MASERNLPARFDLAVANIVTTGPTEERFRGLRKRVAQGIDPGYVGELVREGMENYWPYIFTDLEHEPLIEKLRHHQGRLRPHPRHVPRG